MKETSYSRGIRAHKLCLEVFFRLIRNAFLVWYESQGKKTPEEPEEDCGLRSSCGEQGEESA